MLELTHAIKQYNDKIILNDINIAFRPYETVCLWGESGAGKSTLLNILSGMASLTKGIVTYNNVSIDKIDKIGDYRKRVVSYMPCGDTLLDSLSVRENIMLGKNIVAVSVEDILTDLNILHLIDKKPSEISSGEYKRVCFAKCMIADVPYYLLDEPTSNLDYESAELIRKYINKLQDKKGIIIATHDRLIKCNSDIIYCIKGGVIYEE